MNKPLFAAAAITFTVACSAPPADPMTSVGEPPLVNVEGLVALEDEDPAEGVVEYTLDVGTSQQELLPGQITDMWSFNGLSPGPLLRARVGETVRIHVTNNLPEATTVHWHGLRIDWRMDGVVHGSVIAIEPGETFTYEFVPPDAGTFWYHPHMRSNVQIEAGLYGALIVQEDVGEAPDVDTDRMFVLDDVRLDEDGSIAAVSTAGMDIMHGRVGNVLLANGQSEHPAIALADGRVERWRLVNTANARTLELTFPGLDVTEIGADAGLWPQRFLRKITRLTLPVGARAELEVRLADGATEASMSALVLAQDAAGNVFQQPVTLVPVVNDPALATDEPRGGHMTNPEFERIDEATPVTHEVVLSAVNDAGGFRFTINGEAFPEVDKWSVPADELQVIKIANQIGPEHPFHLHGQWFQVLTRDGFPADENGWRDTVLVGGMSTVTVATYFDNPGNWMYHCHILEHAEAGMMAMLEVQEGR